MTTHRVSVRILRGFLSISIDNQFLSGQGKFHQQQGLERIFHVGLGGRLQRYTH